MLNSIYRFWTWHGWQQQMLPSRQHLYQGGPFLFQKDNAKPHSAHITTAWLHSKRVWVLNWPACSPDLSPIENIWCIMNEKYNKRAAEIISSKNGNTFHFQNYINWSPQFSNGYRVWLKEEVMQHW
uniref:Tc1-like transposase DDE domain-containing protein n=1 Tax=Esox lucius TaxID=8010 RepID=A0AAY5K5G3_ESOLU